MENKRYLLVLTRKSSNLSDISFKMTKIFVITLIFFACFYVSAADSDVSESSNLEVLGRQLVEQGRTLVHHTVKRFMIILPAIFFKLGIAFTLLILIALAAVNNGFIGFLLLVVGMSSVLARLQETRRSVAPLQYIAPIAPYHHHGWDRSGSVDRSQDMKTSIYDGYVGQQQQYSPNPTMTSYYAKYGSAKI